MITLDENETVKYRSKAVKTIGNQIKLDGFRKGSVPEQMIVQKVGEGVILDEMVKIISSKAITPKLIEHKWQPVDTPRAEIETASPFKLKVTIDIFPEIKLGDKWREVKIDKKEIKVEQKAVDEAIDNLQKRFMQRKPVERAAQKNDWVEIDFKGKDKDGVPLDGTDSKAHPMVLGLNTFVPGFEDELIGLKTGEEKTFTITFPADYRAKHLQSKPVTFEVKMRSVNEQVKPEIDEKFAEQVFKKPLKPEEFMAEVEAVLLEDIQQKEQRRREYELVETWAKTATVDIPAVMASRQLQDRKEQIEQRLSNSGMTFEQHLQATGQKPEEVETKMREDAKKEVKQHLVIGEILRQSEIEVTEDEVKPVVQYRQLMQGQQGQGVSADKGSDLWHRVENELLVAKLFGKYLG